MNKTRIGRSRNGKPLELPLSMVVHEIFTALESFTVDEQIDILCTLEYLLFKRVEVEADDFFDQDLLEEVFYILNAKREADGFQDQLEKLGLKTSIDRVNLGQRLAL
jgi:hypothetical protein